MACPVLSKNFVEEAVKLLVTRFIPLNPSDLEEWMADPEEWVNVEEKESDQWQYELRVGARSVEENHTDHNAILVIALRRASPYDNGEPVRGLCATSA